MRIVYLHQYFVTPEMSGGTRSYEMARRLVADGHEVHMITSDTTGTRGRRKEVIEGIQVSWIPVAYSNEMSVIRRIWAFVVFAVLAAIEGLKLRPKVVFATSTPLTIVLPALILKWVKRVPMVFEVRDPWPEMLIGMGVLENPFAIRIFEGLRSIAYKNSKHIIALSDGMKDTIVDTGYDVDRITVIPNSSDLERFYPDHPDGAMIRGKYDWLADRKMVLYAGTLGYANSAGYLVDIAVEVKRTDPEIRFVIVGTGAEETQIRTKAQDTGVLDTNLFMMPKLPKKEIPGWFSAASISSVVLRNVPELWTNSSNKFFDALASGRPVMVNNIGWQQELLEQQNAGLQLHPTDIEAAARKLVEYLHDDEWLILAGGNSRAVAEEMFDRNKLYDRFQQVLINAVKSKRNGNDDQK